LPTARKSILGETTIPPSWCRIGPGDWDHAHLAAVVDPWPELPQAIRAGIVTMATLVRGWRFWPGAALDDQKPYG